MVSKFIKTQLKSALFLGALLLGGSVYAQLGLTWSEMGPNDIAGRCRSLIVSKADATNKTLYAGGVSGGVFKTTDGGANWSPVNDLAPSLIVSSLAQSNDGTTIYYGTGESFGVGGDGAGSSGFIGTGLYKFSSTSSAVTLVKDSSVFGNINELAIDNSNNIYVAGQKGLFISTDGGANFTQETISGSSPAMDVKVAPNGDVYYSAGSLTSSVSTVYRRDFGSSTFTDITPTVITNRCRIEIAPSPVNANYVYLSIANISGGLSAVLVSNNKGTNWVTITLGSAQFDPFLGAGNYANTISADPVKVDACIIGGYMCYGWSQLSSNPLGQGSWYQIGLAFYSPVVFPTPQLFIHPMIHEVRYDLSSNTLFIATDGGITKSVGNGFVPFNKGLNISQFNSVSFPNFPRVNMGTGTQSNIATPYAGVVGGSIGNSLTYLPGNLFNGVQASTNFGFTNAYQSDFSKIIPKAMFYSGSYGSIFRTSDIDIAPVNTFYDQSYKGASSGSPGSSTFANLNTPMRLWENFNNLDSAIFYNETASTQFLNSNKTVKAFNTINARSQEYAKYDTIIIKAVSNKLTPLPTQTINLIPVYSGTNITSVNVFGDANISSASNNTVYVNSNWSDSVKYTFLTAPNDSSTISVTFKMRYDAGDPITLTNTDISGNNFTTSITLASTLYSTESATYQPVVKLPLQQSARLAVGITRKSSSESPSIYVVKRPLNFSINPDWIKIAGKNSRIDDIGGVPSTTAAAVSGTTVTRVEWANDGACLYFSTVLNDTTYYLYRTSHLEFIGDSSAIDYGGAFSSDIDSVKGTTVFLKNKALPRTTALGKFKYPITSISVMANNSGIMVTTGGYNNKTATVYTSNGDVRLLGMNNTDASNFTSKNGTGLPLTPAYASLFEMNDNKVALVGTESGIFSTNDITQPSPTWVQESGGNFPNVPVFQIRQQTYPNYKCYNSGIIYVATHGRGIWSTDKYLTNYAIGIEENETNISSNSNILLFPNPANDATSLMIKSSDEASYKINVYDISGRTLIEQATGKLFGTEQLINLNTTSLNSGVYFVSVVGSNGFTATTKLVISK